MDTSNQVNESLRDWFGKSKSKDGKPGWVQADGSPCANEKGETKTPKCFSSQRLASLKRQGKKGKARVSFRYENSFSNHPCYLLAYPKPT